jgi:autotransporter-associated beta strand protein
VTSSAAVTNFATINILNNGIGRSTLQLDGSVGGVDLDVRTAGQIRLNMNMRNGFAGTAPHIENLAGTNSVGGGVGGRYQVNVGASAPGTNAIFQSDAGLLTLYGTNSSGNLGKYNFVFSGAGNGVIAAQLFDGSSSVTPTTASLIKVDGGTWTINTNLYFTGNITVNGGTLAMGAYGVATNCASFIVASNTFFDVTAPLGGWSLGAAQTLAGTGTVKGNATTTDGSFIQPGGASVAGALTFSNNLVLSAATTNVFDLTTSHAIGGGTNDLIKVVGNLTPNGATIFINSLSSITTGTYRLINYTGTKTGTFGSLAFSGVATGYIDETVAGQINLVVTSVQPPQNLRWTGGNGATWDTGVTANWTSNATPDVNFFSPGDVVTFNDSSSFTNVNITANVQPSSVTFNVTNAPYTITGAGMSVGSGGLTKNGSAVLTLDCSNNFNGPLRVNGGVLKLGGTYGGAVPIFLPAAPRWI